jgi:hypothetical protein
VHPTGVATPMIFNEHMTHAFEQGTLSSAISGNLLDVPYVEPKDVTSAVVWLTGDGARSLRHRYHAASRRRRCGDVVTTDRAARNRRPARTRFR